MVILKCNETLDGISAYSQMFYAIFKFCAQAKFATLDGNPAIEMNGNTNQ